MYAYPINILEQIKKSLEVVILAHEQETMFVPSYEEYDEETDPEGYFQYTKPEMEKFKENIREVNSALRFLKGDSSEMTRFFEQQK